MPGSYQLPFNKVQSTIHHVHYTMNRCRLREKRHKVHDLVGQLSPYRRLKALAFFSCFFVQFVVVVVIVGTGVYSGLHFCPPLRAMNGVAQI